MKVALLGAPRSGKSTVFSALTGLGAVSAAKAGGRGARAGVIKVPDARVDYLASVHKPKKITYAEIGFIDVPGPEAQKNASVLPDAQATAEARRMDALVVVLRAFHNDAVSPPEGGIDPARDAEAAVVDLLLADLQVVDKRRERMGKEGSKGAERDAIEKCFAALSEERPLSEADLSPDEERVLAGFQLLTLKPVILLANTDEAASIDLLGVETFARDHGYALMTLCAQMEAEIATLPEDEQGAFLAELGVTESARARFVRAVYERLNLISFLTAGPDECRAWTIRRGTHAQQAAGKIHSDIERGFIRAEVIGYDDFAATPDKNALKGAGKVRLEGKAYEVRDGDLIEFRFNV